MKTPAKDLAALRKSLVFLVSLSMLSLVPLRLMANDRPNILLAIADDWSYGHAGVYGCTWVKTPGFDRVAKEGILFKNAFTPNAKCAPSRATILTGRYSWQLEEAGNHVCIFPPKFGGYVERLAAEGYVAGFTGKGWGPGIAKDENGKHREITGKRYSGRRQKPIAKGINATDYAGNFEDFLKDVPQGKPWVFWYGATEPHRGYEYQSGVRLGKKLTDIDRVPSYWPDTDDSRHDMLDYAIEVEHYDSHLVKILEHLEKTDQLDNTLIVATSDHGMPFPRVKGQAYLDSNRIPLAIRWPQGIVGKGRIVEDHVNFTDLAPTFLQAANIKTLSPIMQPISGRSLFELFRSKKSGQIIPQRDHVLVGKERHDIGRPRNVGYPIRGICKGNFLYLKNFEPDRWPSGNPETGYLNCDGGVIKSNILQMRRNNEEKSFWNLCFGKRVAEELYQIKDDPDCVKNLASSAEFQDIKQKLLDQMTEELQQQGDPRMFGKGSLFDQYEYADPRTNNFYERYRNGKRPPAGWVKSTDFETEPLDESEK